MGYSLFQTGRLRALPFSDLVSADFEPKHPICLTQAPQGLVLCADRSCGSDAVTAVHFEQPEPTRSPCDSLVKKVICATVVIQSLGLNQTYQSTYVGGYWQRLSATKFIAGELLPEDRSVQDDPKSGVADSRFLPLISHVCIARSPNKSHHALPQVVRNGHVMKA